MKQSIPWLTALAIVTVLFGTVYVVAQQQQRQYADEPQVQLAEDTASQLNTGAKPATLVHGSVDMAASLAPFTIIYDKNGAVVASSGFLDHRAPQAPIGVLQAARGKDYHRVTWEPTDGVRVASVSVAANKYYVLSGRNLRQVEKNVTQSLDLSAFGWLVSLVVLGGAYLWQKRL